ncbi:MAG: tRNA (adenosine(37)-N6)-dimethylallyltransferase MiaA [bacterium]|nr:tRNA (adenosine(37)-N6)-dimethylallyltransferase MiaA [bacterium]
MISKNKNKIIVVCGPTATGKSDLAVVLAKKFDGEVISADSRQVYKGMDIGSGKITKTEMQEVPHHLLDVISPKKVFTVADYQKLANEAIEKILAKNKLPIICGGTGLYIQSIVDDLILPEVPPDLGLRKELKKKSVAELFIELKRLDPKRAENIDSKNPVRLIRAIEIARTLGSVPKLQFGKNKKYEFLQIGLTLDPEGLSEKIHARLLKRVKQGMIAEVERLKDSGVSWKRLNDFGLEYRFVASFLQGRVSKDEMLEKLEVAIRQYAKRQITWFKRDEQIKWFDPYNTGAILEYLDNVI